ncbi:phosphoadenylyl-sulfate reductase [Bacillus chungangensis]|uniref:Adenosine 5'-phosphosulfate reductase n=1 Tax=Bacillus chungangensis TaxID=587633 RepID=A0ABT9WUF6_9BACI|nr:phosphoadenylyl-sulfate reductase [Bacillus chungangensis]MDQ0176522.1 phosphoadenosine phosphosulfate reductase [Bacillus chungangensis]
MAKLTYESWLEPERDFEILNETKGALEVLHWAYETYDDDLVYACSFGVEGIVMIDLISKVNEQAKVVFLDTGLHFAETYELIEKVRRLYPKLMIIMKKPALSVEEQAKERGAALWERQPDACCQIRKVIPLQEILNNAAAWLSGLRREQSITRSNTHFINKDETFRSIKICPLIHWTWKDIWRYVHEHQLPYNPLHDQGFPSIGCKPCTNPTADKTDLRAGRWAHHAKTECGLHQKR